MKKILLLGSGELGKELVIALQRLGQYIIAVDSYKNAPAMQVAHEFEVINMLDGEALDKIVEKHKPDFIVPEIETNSRPHLSRERVLIWTTYKEHNDHLIKGSNKCKEGA